ncbi:MAG TPA: TetR/AcrR family transcriptional regulator [Gammaproteobacteria bacterium]
MRRRIEVEAHVADPRLVEERRGQILDAAIRLFSEKGYYRTTILEIARAAGISSGLIYQYFREKEDILLLALMQVLEAYERELPAAIVGINDPVERLCTALRAYCRVVDGMREATLLAYRSTKSLPPERRGHVMDAELRTNRIIRDCLAACIDGGYLEEMNRDLMVYQYVMFCHAWALKHWALGGSYSVDEYVDEGIALLVEPFLTPRRGRATLRALRARTR